LFRALIKLFTQQQKEKSSFTFLFIFYTWHPHLNHAQMNRSDCDAVGQAFGVHLKTDFCFPPVITGGVFILTPLGAQKELLFSMPLYSIQVH
jgi:hypothetical protein